MVVVRNVHLPEKTKQLDIEWILKQFNDVNPDDFVSGTGDAQRLLDAFPKLAEGMISGDDPNATKDNLIELFELVQLVMEYNGLCVVESDKEMKMLEEGGGAGDAETQRVRSENKALKKEVNELNQDVEQLDAELERLEIANAEHKTEVATLQKTIADLRKTDGVADAMFVRQNLEEMEEKYKRLLRENSDLSDLSEEAKKELRREQLRATELSEELSTTKRELSDMKEDLQALRERQGEQRSEWLRKDKRIQELMQQRDAVQSENAQLLRESEKRESELRALREDVETLAQALQSASKDFEEMKGALADSDGVIEDLSRERDVLRGQVEELQIRLETKGDSDQALVDQINIKIESWKKLLDDNQREMEQMNEDMDALRTENERLSDELENTELDALRKAINDRDAEIEQLRSDLEEQRADMEVLGQNLLKQERHMASEVDKAVGDKLQDIIDLKEEVATLKMKLEEEKKRQTDVDDIVAKKEEELMNARQRLVEYEEGTYGLPEAVAELKVYKLQIHKHEQQIEKLTGELTQRLGQVSRLAYVVEKLKQDPNVQVEEEDDVDISELELRDQLEREQLKYQNRTLLKEIESLEEERAQLKARLRAAAWQRGVYAADKGMTGDEQWEMDEWRANKLMPGMEKPPRPPAPETVLAPVQVVAAPSEVDTQMHQQLVALSTQVDKLLTEKERWGDKESDYRAEIDEMSKKLGDAKEESDVQSRKLRHLLQGVSESSSGERRSTALARIDALLSSWDGESNLMLDAVAAGELRAQINSIAKHMDEQTSSNTAVQNEMNGLRHQLKVAMDSLEARENELKKAKEMIVDMKQALEARAATSANPLPPPDELANGDVQAVIASLNSQLIEALDELGQKERELFVLEGDIEAYGHRFRTLLDQREVLMEEHLSVRAFLEDKIKHLEDNAQSMKIQLDSARILDEEMGRLDELQKESDNDAVTRRIAEMVKKLTLLRVNEANLQRKLLNSTEREKTSGKENIEVKSQAIRMEVMLKQRISELKQHEADALRRLRAMHEELRRSVPRDGLVKLQREFASLARKHSQALIRERELVERNLQLEEISKQVDEAVAGQNEAESSKAGLEAKLKHLEDALQELRSVSGSDSKLQALASDLSQQNARLKVASDHAVSRAELAHRAEKQAIQARTEMNERLTQLEQDNITLAMRTAQLEEKAMSHAEALEDRIPIEQSREQTKRITEMEDRVGMLEGEVTKYRELHRLSVEQVLAVEAQRTQAESKAASLQEGLALLQNSSDEAGRLGRLHHELVNLQLREAEATRLLEHVQQDQERLSAQYRQMESKLAENERALVDSREDTRTRVAALRVALEDLHLRHTGSQPLAKVELFTSTIRRSESARRKLRLEIEKLKEKVQDTEDKAWRAELDMEAERQIRVAVETGEAVQRLRQVMGQATDLKLAERRLTRRGNELQAKSDMLADLNEELEARIADMEAKAVEENATLDQQAFEYLGKLDAMERQLRDTRAERQAAADQEVMMGKDRVVLAREIDPTLPVPKQLAEALQRIGEFRGLAERYMAQCTGLAEKNVDLRDKLQESREAIMKRDMELNEIRLAKPTESKNGSTAENPESDALLAQQRAETQRLFKVAQQTILMMQGLLQRKEEAIVKYQEMLRTSRQQFETDRQRDKSQIEALTAQLATASDVTIARLRSEMDTPNIEVPPKTAELIDEISSLREQLVKVREDHLGLQVELKNCQSSLKIKSQELAECQSVRERDRETASAELTGLKRQLSEQQHQPEKEEEEEKEPEPQAPPPEVEEEPLSSAERREMARMRAELEFREAEHAQMQIVIKKLRSELLDEAELRAQQHTSASTRVEHVEQSESREQELEAKLAKARGEVSKLNSLIADLREQVAKRDKDNGALDERVRQRTVEVRKLQKQVREARESERVANEKVDAVIARREAAPRVRELENRIRVLESQLSSRPSRVPPTQIPRVASEEGSGEDTSAMTAGQKWEAEKKLQRRVEGLRKKLQERNKEFETLQKEVDGLRVRAGAAEKDKEKLSTRVAELARAPRHAVIAAVEELESVASLQAARARLEGDNANLRRVIEVEKAQELARLARENVSLGERLASMEATVNDLRKAVDTPDGPSYDAARRLREELSQVRHKLTALEEQNAELQEANIELRFDKETSALQHARLQKRITELERYREVTQGILAARGLGGRDKDSRELERVVESMKKVIEKLQTENESLRKTAASHVKYMELLKANRALKAELAGLHESEREVREKAAMYDEVSKRTTRLSEQNNTLRRQLRRETDVGEKLRGEVREWERRWEKLDQERAGENKRTRSAIVDAERDWKRKNQVLSDAVEELDTKKKQLELDLRRLTSQNGELLSEVEKARHETVELRRRLIESTAEGGKSGDEVTRALQSRVMKLEKDLSDVMQAKRRLEAELAAFDPQFFEELDDLKYNYSESVKRVQLLEAALKELGGSV